MFLFQLLKPRPVLILIAALSMIPVTATAAAHAGHGKKAGKTEPATDVPAIIKGVDKATIMEDYDPDLDSQLEAKGKLRVFDRNSGESRFIANTIYGNYGNLVISERGHWYYAADNNQAAIQQLNSSDSLTEQLTISTIDGTTHTIVITISGIDESNNQANSAAVIGGQDSASITEDTDPNGNNLLTASGKLTIIDNDSGEAGFIADSINGTYGSLVIDVTGNWNYTASNSQDAIQQLNSNESLKEQLTVSSIDGTSHTINISIFGVDESSISDIVVSWTAPSEREDNQPLSLSEIAGYKVYYGMSSGNYSNSIIIDDGSATEYTFRDFPTGKYYFAVSTSDVDGRESRLSTELEIIN